MEGADTVVLPPAPHLMKASITAAQLTNVCSPA